MAEGVELYTKLFERRIYALPTTASGYEVILIAVTKSEETKGELERV